MNKIERFPAIPLISIDPYLSVWSCGDRPTDGPTRHWAGERKRLEIAVRSGGGQYRLLGAGSDPAAELIGCQVRPTVTEFTYLVENKTVVLSFCTPLLLGDLERLSTPITIMKVETESANMAVRAVWHDDICYNGVVPSPMNGQAAEADGLHLAVMGKQQQNVLGHSGDHICIDWGYAWMASDAPVSFQRQEGHHALVLDGKAPSGSLWALLAYDDVASICYFGVPAKAWYARNGKTIREAIQETWEQKEALWARCQAFDQELTQQAEALGGEDYRTLVCASYRQAISAHKLIADETGKPVFLSKENSSNGCIGTADVSYPSIPLFLLYQPELVKAMCRPILRFAGFPVWKYDYAPHDVGRYPYATGQVYSLKQHTGQGPCDPNGPSGVHLPYYLLPPSADIYEEDRQMPVEECGNMILMLAASLRADGDLSLIERYGGLLEKWVIYLEKNGRDPGEQLCTDDFAGHLARNVNLAFKAICGLAAYGFICECRGDRRSAAAWREKARKIAAEVCAQADRGDHSALTLDGPAESWSMKYNIVWDLLLGFDLCPREWYEKELAWYLSHEQTYGIPLDSRKTYTKSDWILWTAAMSDKREQLERFCAPVARYLRNTPTRVPFSDWYETTDGKFVDFIARSVQGGVFMPLLRKKWAE